VAAASEERSERLTPEPQPGTPRSEPGAGIGVELLDEVATDHFPDFSPDQQTKKPESGEGRLDVRRCVAG